MKPGTLVTLYRSAYLYSSIDSWLNNYDDDTTTVNSGDLLIYLRTVEKFHFDYTYLIAEVVTIHGQCGWFSFKILEPV